MKLFAALALTLVSISYARLHEDLDEPLEILPKKNVKRYESTEIKKEPAPKWKEGGFYLKDEKHNASLLKGLPEDKLPNLTTYVQSSHPGSKCSAYGDLLFYNDSHMPGGIHNAANGGAWIYRKYYDANFVKSEDTKKNLERLWELTKNVGDFVTSKGSSIDSVLEELKKDTELDSKKFTKALEALEEERSALIKSSPSTKDMTTIPDDVRKAAWDNAEKVRKVQEKIETAQVPAYLAKLRLTKLEEITAMREYVQKNKSLPKGFSTQYLITDQLLYNDYIVSWRAQNGKNPNAKLATTLLQIEGINVQIMGDVREAEEAVKRGYKYVLGIKN